MRPLYLGLAALALAGCNLTSKSTPFSLTIDPAALNASCPQASASVTVGGADAVATFSAALGGSAATQTFSASYNEIAQITAHCLDTSGADLGSHVLILYGNGSATPVKVTVGAPVATDATSYASGSGTEMPSILSQ